MPDPTPDPLQPLIQRWLQSDEPDTLLEQLCKEHPEHADALRSRLADLAQTVAPDRSGSAALTGDLGDLGEPKQVGPYRILDTLGEGGMGTVYLAEQKEPVQRRVALKLIKLGMDTKAVVQRFEQERQALAVMDHEGIAKVYDVGTSERGQPYFVMELVKGIPLDEYCKRNRLSLHKRLELMQQVCAAVQHAHQKGVIHRDLKPGNVLVSDLDGRLQIKIIDFGLAKAMGQKLIQESLFTELGVVMGTPEYMAPEQADPSNLDIDTRADVYSLGVMLYQLLVGQLPFSGKELREAGILGMQKLLREVDPPRPSTKLTTVAEESTKVAQQLRITPSALKKALKGDLDWVVVKALEKDRSRRYESANALAADLQRYLDHEPLEAGPPSAAYRLQKLVRRNRGKVAAAALVLSALLLGGVGTYVQWQRAESQRARAEEEAASNLKLAKENEQIAAEKTQLAASETAAKEAAVAALGERDAALQAEKERSAELEAVAQFQQDQFAEIDADLMGLRLRDALRDLVAKRCEARGLDTAATEAAMAAHDDRMRGVDFTGLALGSLDQNFFVPGLRVLDEKFADQPLLQARLRQTIATTLRGLGRLKLAFEPQQQATAAWRELSGDDDPDALTSINNLGALLLARGDTEAAEPMLRDALRDYRRVLGDDHPETLGAINNLGTVLLSQSRFQEAEPLLREALTRSRRTLGEEDPFTLKARNNVGVVETNLGRLGDADQNTRAALRGRRKVLGDAHPDTLASTANLGMLRWTQERPAEAEPLLRKALEGRRSVLGGEHPETLASLDGLADLMQTLGRYDEALLLRYEALRGRRIVLGDENEETLDSIVGLGVLLMNLGRFADAEPLLREVLATYQRLYGDRHQATLEAMQNLGQSLQYQGKFAEAEPILRAVLDVQRRDLGSDHPNTLIGVMGFGMLLMNQQKLEEAAPFLEEACKGLRKALGAQHEYAVSAQFNYAGVLKKLGRLEEAEPEYRAAVEGFRQVLTIEHPTTLMSLGSFGGLLFSMNKLEAAEQAYAEVLRVRRRVLGEDDPDTLRAMRELSVVLIELAKNEEAAPLLLEALQRARRVLGDADPATLRSLESYADVLAVLGRVDEAKTVVVSFLTSTELPGDHAQVLHAKDVLQQLERLDKQEARL